MSDELRKRFDRALDAIAADLAARPDLIGLVFFGSAARGEGKSGSDLDLYAITSEDSSGSIGRIVAGVPTEISFGSLARWTALVREERSTIVHAFATGRAVLDRTQGGLSALCQEARALWDRGPSALSSTALLRFRFHLTDLVRDLEVMPEHAAATALVACAGIRLSIEAHCAMHRMWAPSLRNALTALRPQFPELIASIERCAADGFPRSLAQQVAGTVLQQLGGELDTYDTTTAAGS